MGIELRELGPDEHEEVLALWQSKDGDARDAITPDKLNRLQDNLSVVARDENKVIAAVLCGHTVEGHQHYVAVTASYRDTPVVKQLLDKALRKLCVYGPMKCHIRFAGSQDMGSFWYDVKWAAEHAEGSDEPTQHPQ